MNIVEVEKLKVGMVLSENTVLNDKHIAALKAAQIPANVAKFKTGGVKMAVRRSAL